MLKSKSKSDKTAYAAAIKLLALREHSTQQIRRKLEQRGYPAIEIDDAIAQLLKDNYLSDTRFAESYLRSRKLKGYGPVRIRLELQERGVGSTIIDEVLEADEGGWFELMRSAYERKYGDEPPQDYNDKAKRCRYLQNRGFAASQITKLVD